jgi:hypothetical protein
MLQRAKKNIGQKRPRDAFWTKQFAFFPRVDKCSLINQGKNVERKNVETHLGKFPFILAVAMIRIFFFLSLDGTNVTLRVYLTEKIEVSSRSEKRERATRARCETFFSQIEREKTTQKTTAKKGRREETSPLSSLLFWEKNVSHGRHRAQKTRPARHLATRESRFSRMQTMDAIFFELNESPRAMF